MLKCQRHIDLKDRPKVYAEAQVHYSSPNTESTNQSVHHGKQMTARGQLQVQSGVHHVTQRWRASGKSLPTVPRESRVHPVNLLVSAEAGRACPFVTRGGYEAVRLHELAEHSRVRAQSQAVCGSSAEDVSRRGSFTPQQLALNLYYSGSSQQNGAVTENCLQHNSTVTETCLQLRVNNTYIHATCAL